MSKSRFRRPCIAAPIVVGLASVLLACSSQGTTPSTSASADTESARNAAAAAAEKVSEYSSPDQAFPEVGGRFDPGEHSAVVISGGSSAPVVQENSEKTVEAFEQMGWRVTGPLDGQFNAATVGGYIDRAVADNADSITLTSVNVEDVGESAKRALQAGLTVACLMCAKNDELADLGVMYVTVDFEAQGEILGWYLIDRSQGAGTIVNVVDPGVAATVRRTQGVTATIAANCPDCTVNDDLVLPSADVQKPGPPQWTAFLNSTPEGSVTDVASMADVVGVALSKGLRDIGRTDIRMSGYDADPEAIELIGQENSTYSGTVALPYSWGSWAIADLSARAVAGQDLWESDNLPMQLVTTENVEDFDDLTPTSSWQEEFKSKWTAS